MSLRIASILTLALLAGCGGSSGSRDDGQTAAGSSAAPVTSGTTGVPTTPPVTPPTSGLPTNASLTVVGTPSGGLPVISDLVEFDGKLWLLEALDPLAQFGAQVWTWDAGGFTKVLDDPTSQGYLRGKVFGGKLYVPDGDANGLAPGIVYVFDSASGTPLATTVESAVHNFDVVERGGQLFTSGATDNGASSLNRYDPTTQRWTVVSQGNFSRLKYMALLDGNIYATKRVFGATTADLVEVDGAFSQRGVSLLQGEEALVLCMEAIGGAVYMSLSSNSGVFHVRLEPGPRITQLTGISGAILFDYVRHSDGNTYAVGSDLAGRSFIYGSSDGVDFTRIVDVSDLRFGRVGNNADGRPSIASYQGKVYAGSSTNGTLYRLD